MQIPPILSKLDRVLIDPGWNDSFPNTTVNSLPRTTSDHYPLKIETTSNIPRYQVFRYYNNWPLKPGFKELVSSVWSDTPPKSDAVGTLVVKIKILCQKAKVWKKSLLPDRSHLNNAKRALNLMDWIEDQRALSHIETVFRNLLKRKIADLIHLVAIPARQIGKVAWCVLGDEDSRFFFHSRASSRLRSNLIKTLESGGTRFFIHKEKERVLTNYYRDILGKSFPPQDLLDLEGIYPNFLNLASLTSPFSEAEIHNALKQIPRDKSPGPNGFGSTFFRISET
jgi:hypothetical protein